MWCPEWVTSQMHMLRLAALGTFLNLFFIIFHPVVLYTLLAQVLHQMGVPAPDDGAPMQPFTLFTLNLWLDYKRV